MRIDVLDHGYVSLVESWGSDERIVEAARMSTQKGFEGWGPKCRMCGDALDAPERECPSPSGHKPLIDCGRGGHMFDAPGDEKLLAYLWKNNHATPFEMAGLIIEVQAPIFVFREWHRHRTQSYNEMSARYAPLPDLNYVPSVERLLKDAGTNKQAQGLGGHVLSLEEARGWRDLLTAEYRHAQGAYEAALADGVPKELARLVIPVGRYSRMRASANLRNWLAFMTLRAAPNAQWEIQEYARAVGRMLADMFPRTWSLYAEGRPQ